MRQWLICSCGYRCFPCKQEVDTDKNEKIEAIRCDCQESFDEIAAKMQRKIKSRPSISNSRSGSSTETTSSGDFTDSHGGRAPIVLDSDLSDSDTASRTNSVTTESESQPRSRRAASDTSLTSSKGESDSVGVPSQLSTRISVLGFTNLGNTCYFNAAMQALLTAAHYFPEHVHSKEVLELPSIPIAMTFQYVIFCLLSPLQFCTQCTDASFIAI